MKKIILISLILILLVSCAPQQQVPEQQEQPEPQPPQKSQTDIGDIPPQTTQEVQQQEEILKPAPKVEEVRAPQEHRVTIARYKFSPGELTIKKGDTVVWENLGKTHHALTSHEFQSRPLYQNDQFSHTFQIKGEYVYNSQLYRATQGKIIVE